MYIRVYTILQKNGIIIIAFFIPEVNKPIVANLSIHKNTLFSMVIFGYKVLFANNFIYFITKNILTQAKLSLDRNNNFIERN